MSERSAKDGQVKRRCGADLPVTMITIAAFEVVRLISLPIAFSIALGLLIACCAIFWMAGRTETPNTGEDMK